ncbi:hypothetical protein GOFOIKOB_1942 [Methylobacterium tardum]|nr:hypothetical protein GOFOIKOB_1942 [Methylobacterium tardum]
MGVVQKEPDRAILHHLHLRLLPASLSEPGQARDRQGRRDLWSDYRPAVAMVIFEKSWNQFCA